VAFAFVSCPNHRAAPRRHIIMNHLQKKSSFQSPEDYKEYLEDAVKALETYQRIRRPLMFHLLLLLVIVLNTYILIVIAVIIPILGIVDCFRRIEDGFNEDENPVFKLSSRLVIGDSLFAKALLGHLLGYVSKLKRLWFWKTWAFYPAMFGLPIMALVFALFMLLLRGWFLFLDLFFLRCWDKWLKALRHTGEEKKPLRQIIRGSILNQLPESAGSAPESDPAKETPIEFNWLKEKYNRTKKSLADWVDEEKKKQSVDREKPPKDENPPSTNKGEENET